VGEPDSWVDMVGVVGTVYGKKDKPPTFRHFEIFERHSRSEE
jgi:hypothetical protein